MSLKINHWVRINTDKAVKDNVPFAGGVNDTAEAYYTDLQFSYPKFFKMDNLCKWAWLGAEMLLTDNGISVLKDESDKTRIAVVLMTAHGCFEVDKKYNATLAAIPSPSLFVYTLPNIMLGEISIRHGFKGEQSCMISEGFDTDEMYFVVSDLLNNRNMDACICGWADVMLGHKDICLFWVTKEAGGITFTPADMLQLYKN